VRQNRLGMWLKDTRPLAPSEMRATDNDKQPTRHDAREYWGPCAWCGGKVRFEGEPPRDALGRAVHVKCQRAAGLAGEEAA
jgi:hypothetical protein